MSGLVVFLGGAKKNLPNFQVLFRCNLRAYYLVYFGGGGGERGGVKWNSCDPQ